ncbi:unnamed protein product [Rhizophagus irregularis]|nr:unnamed protein product [Rhizophagus irregularis]
MLGVERVIINNVNINANHGIVKLIEVQKNLKYFEWIDDLDECYDIRVDPYKEILLALEKNADTINHLELFFLYSDRTPQKNFIYYDYYDNFNEHSHILIRKIHENCPSIKYLSLIFPPSKQHFNEFEILLQMCQNLKSLLLIIFMNKIINEEKHLEYGEELLKILIRSSHNNLREIRFLYVKFSLESLEEFFEKWKCRPALSIVTCNRIYKEDNYVKLINKYKNNGKYDGWEYVRRDGMDEILSGYTMIRFLFKKYDG